MPTIWKMPEKYKAILILVSVVVSCAHTALQALVKIFDDSDLTIEEAVAFGTVTAPAIVGKWKEMPQQKE